MNRVRRQFETIDTLYNPKQISKCDTSMIQMSVENSLTHLGAQLPRSDHNVRTPGSPQSSERNKADKIKVIIVCKMNHN